MLEVVCELHDELRDPKVAVKECPDGHMGSFFTSQNEAALAFSSGSWELLSKCLLNSDSQITENLINSKQRHSKRIL